MWSGSCGWRNHYGERTVIWGVYVYWLIRNKLNTSLSKKKYWVGVWAKLETILCKRDLKLGKIKEELEKKLWLLLGLTQVQPSLIWSSWREMMEKRVYDWKTVYLKLVNHPNQLFLWGNAVIQLRVPHLLHQSRLIHRKSKFILKSPIKGGVSIFVITVSNQDISDHIFLRWDMRCCLECCTTSLSNDLQ